MANLRSLANNIRTDPNALAVLAAQERLLPFSAYVHNGRFEAPRHLRRLASALEDVESGKCKRLMLAMPPRHGKSFLASETFPAWYLGKHPDHSIIAATYAQDLADDVGRRVRNTMADPSYSQLFPKSALSYDSKSASRFATVSKGQYFGVGAGGPITGRGAHVAILDDLLKGREEADSEVTRRHMKDWYASVLYTRLYPDGAIVVIGTRWHEDDLTGWLLREHQHENWRVVEMPAVDEDGCALWPERYPIERLLQIERTLGSREWSALYQQQPAPSEGLLFSKEKIVPIDILPANLRVARGWDLAATKKLGTSDPDWTVGVLVGRDKDGLTYVCDVVRFRGGPLEVEQAVLNTARLDGLRTQISIPQDPGQAGKSQAQSFIRLLAGYNVEATPETGNKSTRAAPFAAQVSAGNVRMLKASWNSVFLDELSTFPAGRHDDQVDAASRAFSKVCGNVVHLVTSRSFGF